MTTRLTRPAGAAPPALALLLLLAAPAVMAATLDFQNGSLFYETRGDGPPVILLHDGLMDRQTWDAQWQSPPKGSRFVRYDRRGFGQSPEPAGAFSDVEDLDALMDALHLKRATLVGCSTGGKVAVDFALAHPDRVERLVLEGAVVSGMPFSEHFTERNRAAFRPLVESGDAAATIANWQKDPYLMAPRSEAAKRRLGELLTASPQGLTSNRGRFQRPPLVPAVGRLRDVRVPTLIVVGDSDIPDVHAQAGAIETGIANSRRVVVPNAGHFVHIEQPEAFNRLVEQFLAPPVVAPPRSTIAITHVTVIDTAGGPARPDQTVIVADGRIASVGGAAGAKVLTDARVIDGTGKYLIPGLWDMHVHLLWDPAIDTLFPLCIANGVTGVRDMHTHFPAERVRAWREEVAQGRRIGPRFVWAGPILDGPHPLWPGAISVADAAAARQAVGDLKAKGVDFIKVYEGLPRDAYFAIAQEAKKQGMPFVGHVPEAVTPAEASDAGQRSIEHLSHLLDHCRTDGKTAGGPEAMASAVYDPAKGAELFATFRRNHTWHCPTLVVAETTTFGRDDRIAKDPRRRYLTPLILSRVGFDDSKRDWDATLHYWREERKLMRELHGAGVDLLAGTDAPIVRNVPGFSLHDELKCLADAGLTPAEAIRAATLNPARFLGMGNELGTVEAGKRADLVLLGADPTADIRNVTKIDAVVADGRLFDRAALDRILSGVEAAAKKP